MSNANVINTMVKSIEGMRTYETLARVVETTGKNLEKVTTQLGKV
ncbi:MAG: flagellar basal body rod C-terminal domain-containing protein [Vampirovibrionia bacterium]